MSSPNQASPIGAVRDSRSDPPSASEVPSARSLVPPQTRGTRRGASGFAVLMRSDRRRSGEHLRDGTGDDRRLRRGEARHVDPPLRNEIDRVLLAQALFGDPDIMLLDEPTNNLDINSIRWLEDVLNERQSTMVIISHDRHFLAALSNRVLELTPEGVHQYGGGYTEYVSRTGQEAPGLHPGG